MMRIITGKAKGVRLKTLEGEATRPTAERVKEAVFSMIWDDIADREVLDMFSGSGQMALEALSRGAKHAVMLDKSPLAIKVMSENAEKTRLSALCEIKRADFLDFIKQSRARKFDIVFLDPPYDSGFYKIALENLLDNDMLKPSSIIICESGNEEIFDGDENLSKRFSLLKQSRYGRIYITILTPLFDGEN